MKLTRDAVGFSDIWYPWQTYYCFLCPLNRKITPIFPDLKSHSLAQSSCSTFLVCIWSQHYPSYCHTGDRKVQVSTKKGSHLLDTRPFSTCMHLGAPQVGSSLSSHPKNGTWHQPGADLSRQQPPRFRAWTWNKKRNQSKARLECIPLGNWRWGQAARPVLSTQVALSSSPLGQN